MFQIVAFQTILRKELSRIFRIWTQTLLPSPITQALYLLIFGNIIGSRIGASFGGVSYIDFITPGLILMAMITNSYSNVSGSFYMARFQKSLEELLVAPVSNLTILLGYTVAGLLRGLINGISVYLVSLCFGTSILISNVGILLFFVIMINVIFSLFGFFNGIFAKSFDDISLIPTFVLTPLTYLGGVFYPISQLPQPWQTIAQLNPIVYMIDGLRAGFSNSGIYNVYISMTALIVCALGMFVLNLVLLGKGTNIRS
jgi:ABC-2 type transport system permease protein